MALLVFIVFIVQLVRQTPTLKSKFTQKNLEDTQAQIIEKSTKILEDTTNLAKNITNDSKKYAEDVYKNFTKPKDCPDKDCSKQDKEIAAYSKKLHDVELELTRVKRDLQTCQGKKCDCKTCEVCKPQEPCICPDQPSNHTDGANEEKEEKDEKDEIEIKIDQIKDKPTCLQHMKTIWNPIVNLLPDEARDVLLSAELLQKGKYDVKKGFHEIIAQLVYLHSLLPRYEAGAKESNCKLELACEGQFNNFGHDCLIGKNKLSSHEEKQQDLLKKMVEKDTRKEDELTEADYLDRFNIRCNAKKFFEDLVMQAESTNIASTCSDANIQI